MKSRPWVPSCVHESFLKLVAIRCSQHGSGYTGLSTSGKSKLEGLYTIHDNFLRYMKSKGASDEAIEAKQKEFRRSATCRSDPGDEESTVCQSYLYAPYRRYGRTRIQDAAARLPAAGYRHPSRWVASQFRDLWTTVLLNATQRLNIGPKCAKWTCYCRGDRPSEA